MDYFFLHILKFDIAFPIQKTSAIDHLIFQWYKKKTVSNLLNNLIDTVLQLGCGHMEKLSGNVLGVGLVLYS